MSTEYQGTNLEKFDNIHEYLKLDHDTLNAYIGLCNASRPDKNADLEELLSANSDPEDHEKFRIGLLAANAALTNNDCQDLDDEAYNKLHPQGKDWYRKIQTDTDTSAFGRTVQTSRQTIAHIGNAPALPETLRSAIAGSWSNLFRNKRYLNENVTKLALYLNTSLDSKVKRELLGCLRQSQTENLLEAAKSDNPIHAAAAIQVLTKTLTGRENNIYSLLVDTLFTSPKDVTDTRNAAKLFTAMSNLQMESKLNHVDNNKQLANALLISKPLIKVILEECTPIEVGAETPEPKRQAFRNRLLQAIPAFRLFEKDTLDEVVTEIKIGRGSKIREIEKLLDNSKNLLNKQNFNPETAVKNLRTRSNWKPVEKTALAEYIPTPDSTGPIPQPIKPRPVKLSISPHPTSNAPASFVVEIDNLEKSETASQAIWEQRKVTITVTDNGDDLDFEIEGVKKPRGNTRINDIEELKKLAVYLAEKFCTDANAHISRDQINIAIQRVLNQFRRGTEVNLTDIKPAPKSTTRFGGAEVAQEPSTERAEETPDEPQEEISLILRNVKTVFQVVLGEEVEAERILLNEYYYMKSVRANFTVFQQKL
jgi:hypothetical protein